MKKDRNSANCQLRALQNSFPESLGPIDYAYDTQLLQTTPTPTSFVQNGLLPFRGLGKTLQGVSPPAVFSMGMCRVCTVYTGFWVSGKPETEWGEGKRVDRGVWWPLLGALVCPERERCPVPHCSGHWCEGKLGLPGSHPFY